MTLYRPHLLYIDIHILLYLSGIGMIHGVKICLLVLGPEAQLVLQKRFNCGVSRLKLGSHGFVPWMPGRLVLKH